MIGLPRLIKNKSEKASLPPGSMVFIGDVKTEASTLNIIDYDDREFIEKKVKTIDECLPFKDLPTVTWFNVTGLHQTDVIERMGGYFELHPLLMEDIVNTGQRPKIDDYGKYLFFVLKTLQYDEANDMIKSQQVSFILGPNYVISFQEVEGDLFDPIRDRIRTAKGIIRRMGPDYLTYALIDTVVDNYFIILEKLGDKIEFLEDELVINPGTETLQAIHNLKRELIFLRKSVWPLREVVSRMERGGFDLIKQATGIYLRDVYDHTIQVIDAIETYRDLLSGMLDIYLSSISNKMNEIMKVLTIIGTIFIPLTFIAGIYGMNFSYMPELGWRWGYPIVLTVMLIISGVMVHYFKGKKWL
jgi:magnesium transporter